MIVHLVRPRRRHLSLLDLDGLDDLWVSAKQNDDNGSNSGKVYVILGRSLPTISSGGDDLSIADFSVVGEADCDEAGSSVASAVDVDGDERPDLLVGAPGYSNGLGMAYLMLSGGLSF